MSKDIMIGANRYIRERGALEKAGELVRPLGQKAFIIGGKRALSKALPALGESLAKAGITYSVHTFTTEVSPEQSEEYRGLCMSEGADFVIGIGGGKALDISKWTADLCNLPVVTVPTCAATCACMVSLIITYFADGQARCGIYAVNSPYLCLADTAILANAPVRLLAAGVADTLSKWAETHYAMRNAEDGVFNFLTSSLSRKVYDELLLVSPGVIQDIQNGKEPDDELIGELMDLIFFMSALVGNTAGDAYRLAIAHGMHDALIAVNPSVIHRFFHGEKVGYGTLIQLLLLRPELDEETLKATYELFHNWGLPTCLEDFGLNCSDESVDALVKALLIPKIQNGPSHTAPEVLKNAILELETWKKH